MLWCVWPALNPLSIHVTFTAIVPGAYPEEAKVCKNVLKWRTFELTGWINGKRLKIDGYMLRCVWPSLNPLSIRVTFTAIVAGAYPGEAKMCLRLSWGSQMPPPAKRVQATTYRRDSPDVAKLCLKPRFHYPSWRPELTARVDGWPVSITRQHGPCWRARVSTSRVDQPCWRFR